MLRIVFTLILISFMIIGCSQSKETVKIDAKEPEPVESAVNDVELEIEKSIGWVNLMPGSAPKFHISGKFSLLKNPSYDYKNAVLKYIRIYQSDNELYYINPKVLEEVLDNKKQITYSTISGLSLKKSMRTDEPVSFELIFMDNWDELKYLIEDVSVEEVQ